MKSKHPVLRSLCVIVAALFLVQALSCGTVLYPERKGQAGGRIDPGVAILDGAGLLLFVIPGIVAFGVDFTTGAIYLPPVKKSSGSPDGEGTRVVLVEPDKLDRKSIEETVSLHTGCQVRLDQGHVRIISRN